MIMTNVVVMYIQSGIYGAIHSRASLFLLSPLDEVCLSVLMTPMPLTVLITWHHLKCTCVVLSHGCTCTCSQFFTPTKVGFEGISVTFAQYGGIYIENK